jgi:ABC-type dipeptide/oligopeptide/nickel transport system permease component
MFRFILRRLLTFVPTLLGALLIIFVIMRVVPGDPALSMLSDYASQASIQELRVKLGVDQPLAVQFGEYLQGLLHGDLGKSFTDRQPVTTSVLEMLPHTLILTVSGIILSILIGIPTGILSATRRNSMVDHFSRVFALLGLSMPAFYLGILLLIFLSFKLDWFPVSGAGEFSSLPDLLYRLILPALTLGLVQAAFVMRITRSSMLEVLSQDFIRTARAKGVAEYLVVYKHALRNALIPITTVVGLYMGYLMGGAVLETVCSRPGIGKLLVEGIKARDYPLVQGTIIFIALIVISINLVVDIIYGLIDPRVSYE